MLGRFMQAEGRVIVIFSTTIPAPGTPSDAAASPPRLREGGIVVRHFLLPLGFFHLFMRAKTNICPPLPPFERGKARHQAGGGLSSSADKQHMPPRPS